MHFVEGPARDRRQLTWYPRGVHTEVSPSFDAANPNTFVFLYDPANTEARSVYRYDMASGEASLVAKSVTRYPPIWAKQGKWLAFDSAERNAKDHDLFVSRPIRSENQAPFDTGRQPVVARRLVAGRFDPPCRRELLQHGNLPVAGRRQDRREDADHAARRRQDRGLVQCAILRRRQEGVRHQRSRGGRRAAHMALRCGQVRVDAGHRRRPDGRYQLWWRLRNLQRWFAAGGGPRSRVLHRAAGDRPDDDEGAAVAGHRQGAHRSTALAPELARDRIHVRLRESPGRRLLRGRLARHAHRGGRSAKPVSTPTSCRRPKSSS